MTTNLQLTVEGKLKHFLTPEGLSAELLTQILDTAETFIDNTQSSKKIKSIPNRYLGENKTDKYRSIDSYLKIKSIYR